MAAGGLQPFDVHRASSVVCFAECENSATRSLAAVAQQHDSGQALCAWPAGDASRHPRCHCMSWTCHWSPISRLCRACWPPSAHARKHRSRCAAASNSDCWVSQNHLYMPELLGDLPIRSGTGWREEVGGRRLMCILLFGEAHDLRMRRDRLHPHRPGLATPPPISRCTVNGSTSVTPRKQPCQCSPSALRQRDFSVLVTLLAQQLVHQCPLDCSHPLLAVRLPQNRCQGGSGPMQPAGFNPGSTTSRNCTSN